MANAAMFVLIGAGLSSTIWSVSAGRAGAWPLLVALPVLAISSLHDRSLLRRTPMDLPLALFVATALVGLWAAYNRIAAQEKFWMLIAACLLFYAIVAQPVPNLWTLAAFLAVLGMGIAIFFFLSHDWQSSPPELAAVRGLVEIFLPLQALAAVRLSLNMQGLHPNVAASLMAILVPFQIALALHTRWEGHKAMFLVYGVVLAMTVIALLLTSSRGAFLALTAGLAIWLISQILKRRVQLLRYSRLLLALLGLAVATILFFLAGGWGWQILRLLDRFLPGPASAISRAQLAGQTTDLIASFPFTGGGLASFPGLHARYILGIRSVFLPNAHNILLDVTLEQGFLASVALLLIIAATLRLLAPLLALQSRSKTTGHASLLAGAALASFLILLIHGMVEDTVYGSPALPLLFLAPALAIALDQAANPAYRLRLKRWDRTAGMVIGVAALAVIGAALTPRGRALWQANIGAIAMARVELRDFPTDRWAEPAPGPALRSAQQHFEASLKLDPGQRTARYRLGLLEMQRGHFQSASEHLQIAYKQDSQHIGIRKALGYSYAWSGDMERAGELLATAPFVAQELDTYIPWWRERGRNDLSDAARQMRAYLKNQRDRNGDES